MLGVNALFATAYGNVGSSIYYALGLVASFALGLTPVVFVITGIFFFCTAATYAEATAMYPEAGGSSSFARRAFNEFVSFFAAWAQMLNYTITVAISAFFVPHYIGGLFWEPLRSAPGDIIFGAGRDRRAGRDQRRRRQGVGRRQHPARGRRLPHAAAAGAGRRACSCSRPPRWSTTSSLGVAPTWKNFILAIPIGMIAYTGIETISNMAEEAKDEAQDDPGRDQPRADRRVRDLLHAAGRRAVGAAGRARPATGEYQTLLGLPRRRAASPATRSSAWSSRSTSGRCSRRASSMSACSPPRSCSSPPTPALIGVSRLVYSMGIHRQVPDALRRLHPRFRTPWIGILVFGAAAIVTLLPGQAEFLGYMYAFGAMLSFTIAHIAVMRLRATEPDLPRPYRGPGNLQVRGYDLPLFAARSAGSARRSRSWSRSCCIPRWPRPASAGWCSGSCVYVVYRRRQGLDLRSTHKVAIPQPVVDHEAEYDSVLVPLLDGGYDEHVLATAAKLAARKRRGIHVLALVTVPNALPIDAPMADEEAAAPLGHRGGQGPGRPARVRAHREDPRRPGGAADHRGGDRHARGRDRDAAAPARRGRVAVRQDARDRPDRAAVPGRSSSPSPTPRSEFMRP